MGIAPCGKGNDLARVLNIPRETAGATEVLLKGEARGIDLGRAGDRYFCTVAGVGFDAEVARSINEDGVPFGGTAAYVYGILKTLLTFRSPSMRLTGDFGTVEGRVFLAATGNTSTYGGGMRIVPQAVCDDGMLDVCVVRHVSRWKALLLFPRVFSGTHVELPEVEVRRTRRLRIESPTPMWVFGDGEALCRTPATLEVAERALQVLCPRSGC
jgi:diacylglycerol kinase (ATP)